MIDVVVVVLVIGCYLVFAKTKHYNKKKISNIYIYINKCKNSSNHYHSRISLINDIKQHQVFPEDESVWHYLRSKSNLYIYIYIYIFKCKLHLIHSIRSLFCSPIHSRLVLEWTCSQLVKNLIMFICVCVFIYIFMHALLDKIDMKWKEMKVFMKKKPDPWGLHTNGTSRSMWPKFDNINCVIESISIVSVVDDHLMLIQGLLIANIILLVRLSSSQPPITNTA